MRPWDCGLVIFLCQDLILVAHQSVAASDDKAVVQNWHYDEGVLLVCEGVLLGDDV